MKRKPMMAYTCEYCGRQFPNYWDCNRHEEKCKELQRRETCPECDGNGKVFWGYGCGSYVGFGYYEKVKDYRTCRKCGGRGWIYKD